MPSLVVMRADPTAESPITSDLLGTNIGLIVFIDKWLGGRYDPLITHTAYVEERSVPNNGRLRAANARQRGNSALIDAKFDDLTFRLGTPEKQYIKPQKRDAEWRKLAATATRRDAGRHERDGSAHRLRLLAV